MARSPEQIAADKAAIDADLMKLISLTRQRVKLPPANPDPSVGPFAHLRAALKVMKREPLVKHVKGFENSWLDFILREQQELPRPWPRGLEALVRDWGKKATAQRKLLQSGGVSVLINAKGQAFVICPPGPGAVIYAADEHGVTCLGNYVAEFVQREVASMLGTPVAPLEQPKVDTAAVRDAAKRERALEKLRKAQPPSSTVHGALVHAWSVSDLKSNDALLALDELAREHDLALFAGCGDVENTSAKEPIWLGHWLVGVELAAVRGVTKKTSGFSFDAAALADANKKLDAIAAPLKKLCAASASKPERGTYVVARGGLPLVRLVKGAWVDPPAAIKRDPGAFSSWLSELPSSDDGVGYSYGTNGATQSPGPGAVQGLRIGGADACAEAITWSAKQDKDLDRTLTKAGIKDAQYFLITRYD